MKKPKTSRIGLDTKQSEIVAAGLNSLQTKFITEQEKTSWIYASWLD